MWDTFVAIIQTYICIYSDYLWEKNRNPLKSTAEILDATLCDKVCQWLVTGWWFSPGTPVSFTNKTDCHDMTEILLKVALNTINQPKEYISVKFESTC